MSMARRPMARREALGTLGAAGEGLVMATADRVAAGTHGVHALAETQVDVLRHGAYICLGVPDDRRQAALSAPLDELVRELGLTNEFEPGPTHPTEAVAYLRRMDVTDAQIADSRLSNANVVIHAASPSAAVVARFAHGVERLVGAVAPPYILMGVVRPPNFTGGLMHRFAYANQVTQQPGRAMPHAFLLPTRKTAEWWTKDWMEPPVRGSPARR